MLRFRQTVLEALLFQATLTLLGFMWVVIAARYLDVSSMGDVMVAIGAASTITMLCGFGLQHGIAVKSRVYDNGQIVSNGLALIILAGIIAGVFSYVIAVSVSVQQKLDVSPFLCAVVSLTQVLYIYALSLLRTINRFRLANSLSIVQPLFFNLLLILYVSGHEFLATRVVLMTFCASQAISVFAIILSFLRLNLFGASRVKYSIAREIIHFGWKAQAGNISKEALYRGDLYVVTAVLGSSAAGNYSVVLKLIEGLGRFVDAIGAIVLPIVARFNKEKQNTLTKNIMLITIPISTLIAIIVFFFSDRIIVTLFGEQFYSSIHLLKIGVFAFIPLALWKLLANDFIGRGLLLFYFISATIGAAIIILTNYFLLDRFGLTLAPWVMVLSYTVSACVLLAAAHYSLGVRILDFHKNI